MTTATMTRNPRAYLRQLEQEDHCRALLHDRVTATIAITVDTARIIAASIHGGTDTALSRFAATGTLNVPDALTELEHIHVPEEHVDWVVALWEHLEHRDDSAPGDAHTERR